MSRQLEHSRALALSLVQFDLLDRALLAAERKEQRQLVVAALIRALHNLTAGKRLVEPGRLLSRWVALDFSRFGFRFLTPLVRKLIADSHAPEAARLLRHVCRTLSWLLVHSEFDGSTLLAESLRPIASEWALRGLSASPPAALAALLVLAGNCGGLEGRLLGEAEGAAHRVCEDVSVELGRCPALTALGESGLVGLGFDVSPALREDACEENLADEGGDLSPCSPALRGDFVAGPPAASKAQIKMLMGQLKEDFPERAAVDSSVLASASAIRSRQSEARPIRQQANEAQQALEKNERTVVSLDKQISDAQVRLKEPNEKRAEAAAQQAQLKARYLELAAKVADLPPPPQAAELQGHMSDFDSVLASGDLAAIREGWAKLKPSCESFAQGPQPASGEITCEHYMGVILFPGTSRRPTLDGRHSLFQHDYHWELFFGWTNKSCGGSIFLHQRFPQAHLRRIYPPPAALSGRCGATVPLLGRAPHDSAPFRATRVLLQPQFIPPGGPGYDLVGTHRAGVCGQSTHALQRGGPQLGDSVDETFLGPPSLLEPDLWSEVDSAVGPVLELEGLSGRLWQRFLSDHDTLFVSGDTFIGAHGRSRRTDFLHAPCKCKAPIGAGRRLNTLYDRDHRSVYAGDIFEAHAQHTWDYDAIMLRLEGALKSRDLQQAVTFLPKTARQHAQQLRDLAASEWISIVTPPTATSIVAAREAGKMYAAAAQFKYPSASVEQEAPQGHVPPRTFYQQLYTRMQFASADQITLRSVNPDGPRETCLDQARAQCRVALHLLKAFDKIAGHRGQQLTFRGKALREALAGGPAGVPPHDGGGDEERDAPLSQHGDAEARGDGIVDMVRAFRAEIATFAASQAEATTASAACSGTLQHRA
ncbi:unnamed protein product [Prorocentrum cordatum]|uniref:Uncharacterized protein n=1 Tax=Prorocentrum cordatum TaxID=2364126 RepID=A0ABN9TRL6_9DINO|nr:unnamed protein product [Polarella glacialis]